MPLGHTGRKLGEKQKESAEITSTNSFSTSQDQVQTGTHTCASISAFVPAFSEQFQFKVATESRHL